MARGSEQTKLKRGLNVVTIWCCSLCKHPVKLELQNHIPGPVPGRTNGIKKMKKRKELDALLLNNMNGKKISKSCNGKEGHELLRNEASWDSNSTENEDFFSPPRKLMIRT